MSTVESQNGQGAQHHGHRLRNRLVGASFLLLIIVVLALLPPLINVNRFQRRIASSISQSIGRPVHLDSVTMNLLPLPGFTLENFVVSEDPSFGAEPVMRANEVKATLRVSSLWRGHLEFATISLTEPSVNLVRNASGQWNLETILLQASQASETTAPTTQRNPGPAPRFPYIEATDARVNVKLGDEKTPYSLTNAQFALWLPNAQEWRLRLKAKPARTDTDASDTGELRIEATLRRSAHMGEVPLQAEAVWQKTPLGEASKVILGYDAGWRGSAAADIHIDGTLSNAVVKARLHLTDVRRADFFPAQLMDVDATCEAHATGTLRELHDVRCSIPAKADGRIAGVAGTGTQGTLALTGDLPNLLNWRSADLHAGLVGVNPEYALDWLRLFSQRVPTTLHPGGEINGSFSYGPATQGLWAGSAQCECLLDTPVAVTPSHVTASTSPVTDIQADIADDGTGGRALHLQAVTPLPMRGMMEAWANSDGLRLHLPPSNAEGFLPAMATRLPPLFDGLDPDATGDWTGYRTWGSAPVWIRTVAAPRKRSRR